MTTVFPAGLDNFTNPTAADNLNSVTVPHADQHANENDAIEALEAKVGIDGSLVTGSLDYRVSTLEGQSGHSPVTLGIANGLVLSGQTLSMNLAGANSTGTLSAQDWNIFNNKQSSLSFPLAASLGGTSVSNTGTFTNHSNTIIVGGGTINLNGNSLTFPLPASLGGTGIANGASASLTLPNLAITLGGGGAAQTYTLPAAGGTFALLNAANTFTGVNIFTAQGGLQAYLNGVTSNFIAGSGAGKTDMTGTSNVFIGLNCAPAVTSGSFNVGIGQAAFFALTSGSSNFGLGRNALVGITTQSSNVAIGQTALRNGTTLSQNIGIGDQVGQSITGTDNVIIGYQAAGLSGTVRTSIDFNTIIGSQAMFNLGASSDRNVAIGMQSGFNHTSGSSNIFIGYFSAWRQTSVSSLFVIDNQQRASTTVEAENCYLYGSMAADGYLQLNISSTKTATIQDTLKLQAYTSGTAAAGFGVGLPFLAETATADTYQLQGAIHTVWRTATNTTRKASMLLYAYDTAARLGIEIEADGSAAKLGFYGVTPVARATTGIAEATFTENAGGTAVNVDSTFGGYTLQQVVQALQDIGILT